jgi:beta-N-acetylhexosaminidase
MIKKILIVYALCFLKFSAISAQIEMTLEEKIGQLLIAHFHGVAANEDAQFLIQQNHIGGIIYFSWANELKSPASVLQLSRSLQQLASQNRLAIPLFIAIDQEGGIVTRLNQGFTFFSGNYALGQTKQPLLARQAAYSLGKEMKAVGINLNLAPVVDITAQALHPIIGLRAFGSSPTEVILFGSEALAGYHEASIITTLKHFPGHGHVTLDSHVDLPIVNASKEELEANDLAPFRALAHQTDLIMTAHLLVPALDPEYCATISSKVLQGVLRQSLGFKGLIVSDALSMQGLLKQVLSIEEAAIQAIDAGCDLLILGGRQIVNQVKQELTVSQINNIHQALVDAVKQGRLSEEKINQSVEKILNLKKTYKLTTTPLLAEESWTAINSLAHQQVAKMIAQASVKIVHNQLPLSFSLDQKKIAIVTSKALAPIVLASSFSQLLDFSGSILEIEQTPSFLKKINEADVLFLLIDEMGCSASDDAFILDILKCRPTSILICTRFPPPIELFPQASLIVHTFSPTLPSLQAAYDLFSPFFKHSF